MYQNLFRTGGFVVESLTVQYERFRLPNVTLMATVLLKGISGLITS